jgi:hypothetical protein
MTYLHPMLADPRLFWIPLVCWIEPDHTPAYCYRTFA